MIYVPADTFVDRANPLTKATIVAAALLVALAEESGPRPLLIFIALMLGVAVAARVLKPLLGALARIVLPIAVSLYVLQWVLALVQGLLSRQSLGALALALLDNVDVLGLRILAFVTAVLVVLLTTHPGRLVQAAAVRGAPPGLCYALAAALQIIPATAAHARAITDAQRARGLVVGRGLWGRARALPPLIAPLLLSTLQSAEEQAMALEARGFSRRGPRTSFFEVAESPAEPLLRWAILAAAALAFAHLRGWL
ncbi:MAG: energy-coupling factor transporter transmembrane protein EcfT [Armatimonadetes bacterium]|nr:energy-coupling factor transporter transmembrane protein EcfT [Armatimonadota bacterium]